MPKVTIEADTTNNTLSILVDGVAVVDPMNVSVYTCKGYYDETSVDVCISSEAKSETGVKTYTTIIANEKKADANIVSEFFTKSLKNFTK